MNRRTLPVSAFRGQSFVDLLRWRAAEQDDEVVFRFLPDGEGAPLEMSYAELDRRARAIAAALSAVASPGDRALLLSDGGLEFIAGFFGCLYAGVVAVPAYPPEPARLERTLPRLVAILEDADPRVVLTTAAIAGMAALLRDLAPPLGRLPVLATDDIASGGAGFVPRPVGADTVALLQYTSGSTAAPKGVIVTHGNLLANEAMIHQAFEHDERTAVGAGWLPLFHDMGLMGYVLQPLYLGFPTVLMSPLAFLERPIRWLAAITRYGATTAGGPNFAYELCVRRTTPADRAGLDLRSWTLAFSGAEPIAPATLDRFTAVFAPHGFRREAFYPCYGLAEATLIVTGGRKAAPPVLVPAPRATDGVHAVRADGPGEGAQVVACGAPLGDEWVLIVDPETAVPSPPGAVGEVWVAGSNVTRGYWRQPDETAATFAARLHDGTGPFLRTGDLAFVHDGELIVAGRRKDLVIVRGRNHYPQDIERTVAESHPALRPGSCAAFAAESGQGVVVVQEVRTGTVPDEFPKVVRAARQAVTATHGVPLRALVLIEAGSIPKTSSGKVRRAACRALFLDGGLSERWRWVHGRGRVQAA